MASSTARTNSRDDNRAPHAAQPPERALDSTREETPHRLLPWTTDAGKPCLLRTDDPGGFLSRVADNLEDVQTAMAKEALSLAEKALTNPLSSRAEIEYAGLRLSECLADVLRVAESRRLRLAELAPCPEPDEGETDAKT